MGARIADLDDPLHEPLNVFHLPFAGAVDVNVAVTAGDDARPSVDCPPVKASGQQPLHALGSDAAVRVARSLLPVKPSLWLDATSVDAKHGAALLAWRDVSGNHADALHVGTSAHAVYTAHGFAGQPAVQFSSHSAHLQASISVRGDVTVVAGPKPAFCLFSFWMTSFFLGARV